MIFSTVFGPHEPAFTAGPLAVMANDPTVKAGSWGPKTVEKISASRSAR